MKIIIILLILLSRISLFAQILNEFEPNDSMIQANLIELGDSVKASIMPWGDYDYFKFSAAAGDILEITAEVVFNNFFSCTFVVHDKLYNNFDAHRFYWGPFKSKFKVPSTQDYYIYVNLNYSEWSSLDSPTGDYSICIKRFVPTAPVIKSIDIFGECFNSAAAEVHVSPNGLPTRVSIEYGTTINLGNKIIFEESINDIDYVPVLANINNLSGNTSYFIRAAAENDSGTVFSSIIKFETPEEPENWIIKSMASFPFYYRLSDVSFADENTGFAIDHNANLIFKTTDGGTSWVSHDSSYGVFRICCIDTNNAIALNEKGVLKTTNGGLTWVYTEISSSSLYNMYFLDLQNGFVVGFDGRLLKTTDGGKNWIYQNCGTMVTFLSVFFLDENNGWIGGDNGKLFKTTNGGKTWTEQTMNAVNIGYIFFSDVRNGYVCSSFGNIYKTTDGGSSWTSRKSRINDCGYAFSDSSNGIIVGRDGKIEITTDAGKTWIPQKSGTFNDLIAVTNSGKNWIAVGSIGTILKSNYTSVFVSRQDQVSYTYELSQNYPNPFNPGTKIKYELPIESMVHLKIYNVLGEMVREIVSSIQPAGHYEQEFIAKDLPSGIYFYSMDAKSTSEVNNFRDVKKMILIK